MRLIRLENNLSNAKPHENPLVPNRKLRQMYVAMMEARVLAEHIANSKSRHKSRTEFPSTCGEEACRVSTAIDLAPSDLVSDSQPGIVMDLLAGIEVGALLHRIQDSGRTTHVASKNFNQLPWILPWIEDTNERLRLAMGAALSSKTLAQGNLVLAYVRNGEIGKNEWRTILKIASNLELPISFVILPNERSRREKDPSKSLEALSRSCGVPGIVVDAHDALALYRVAQETLGRIRGGGGPVLIDCKVYDHKGCLEAPVDPVSRMKDLLLTRKIATTAWLESTEDKIRRRVAAANR